MKLRSREYRVIESEEREKKIEQKKKKEKGGEKGLEGTLEREREILLKALGPTLWIFGLILNI